jgi:hypothetical protein
MNDQRESWQGKIIASYTVYCGRCDAEEHAGKVQPATRFREWGWKLTRKDGWVCPECIDDGWVCPEELTTQEAA